MKREMEAYIVLLHLVSQGWAMFSDIRHLVGWDVWKHGQAIDIIAHINHNRTYLAIMFDIDFPNLYSA